MTDAMTESTCKAADCDKTVRAKGYCDRHYRSWRKGKMGKPRHPSCNEAGCGKAPLRRGLCADLGFSPRDRGENIRRAGEVARLFFEQGSLVLCAFVSPYRRDRESVRALFPSGRFIEVFVDASIAACRARDPKGLYQRASSGQLADFTGLSAPYERPDTPDLTIDSERLDVAEAADLVIAQLRSAALIGP